MPVGKEVGFSLVRISPCLEFDLESLSTSNCVKGEQRPGARLLDLINGGSKPATMRRQRWKFFILTASGWMCIKSR